MAPTKRRSGGDSGALITRLRALLSEISGSLPDQRDHIRNEVRRLAEIITGARRLARLRLKTLTTASASRDRILAYLKLFVGDVVEGRELQVVGGIQEFARRVRELRVQSGYKISTGTTDPALRPDQYRLDSVDPDEGVARKWKVMNDIRRKDISGMDRALELMKAFVGQPVKGEDIKYVAKIRSSERRVHQLRTEFGWRVVTRNTGRPDLANDVYVLETLEQLPPHDRHIPVETYDGVLDRDRFACRKCGWAVEKRNPAAKRQFLEVHHIEYHHKGGTNKPENLVTLCNVHHDEVHRLKLFGQDLLDWLKK